MLLSMWLWLLIFLYLLWSFGSGTAVVEFAVSTAVIVCGVIAWHVVKVLVDR